MTKRFAVRILGLVAAVVGINQPAHALDVLMPAKVTIIKPGLLAKFVSSGSFILPSIVTDNPTVEGGTISMAGATGSFAAELPAPAWKGLGTPAGSKGFKYKGAGTPSDPCKVVIVKATVVKGVCKTTDTLAVPEPGPIEVVLTVGTDMHYCALCGGTPAGDPSRLFKAKNCPAPSACPERNAYCTADCPAAYCTPVADTKYQAKARDLTAWMGCDVCCVDNTLGAADPLRKAVQDKGVCAAANIKLVAKVSDCTGEVMAKFTAAGNTARKICLVGHGAPGIVTMGSGVGASNGMAGGDRDRLDDVKICAPGSGANVLGACANDAACDDDPPCMAGEADCEGKCASSKQFFIGQLAGKVSGLHIFACSVASDGGFMTMLANGLGAPAGGSSKKLCAGKNGGKFCVWLEDGGTIVTSNPVTTTTSTTSSSTTSSSTTSTTVGSPSGAFL